MFPVEIAPSFTHRVGTINLNNSSDVSRHDRMVALVTQMPGLNKKLQNTRLNHEKTQVSRMIQHPGRSTLDRGLRSK
jgi:hypothetical protein